MTKPLPARLIASLLALFVIAGGSTPSSADTIREAREKREQTRAQQAEAAAQVELLEAQTEEVAQALSDIEESVAFQQAQVDAARGALLAADALVVERENQLAATGGLIDATRAEAAQAAVDAYITGVENDRNTTWLETDDLVLGARMAALLQEAGIEQGDAIDALRLLEAEQGVLRTNAEEAKTKAEELRVGLEADLIVLEERLAIEEEVRAEYERRLGNWRAEVESLELEDQRLSDDIKALTQAEFGFEVGDPGAESIEGYVKPVAGAIGSGFGSRIHPIYGYARMHNGIDMGGSTGDPIWAAKAGEVIWAGPRGGYGNVVIIDHGGGATTVYAHQSKILVSVGERVDGGEVIGRVGSTGLSTGPHLHFEFRYYGEPKDPLLILP